MSCPAATTLAGLLALASASAMPAQAAAPAAQPQSDAAPASSEPQQTSATFGDWVVRCDRPAPVTPDLAAPNQAPLRRLCEAGQAVVVKGQQGPIAQIAFGHAPVGNGVDPALTLTVLLPTNVAFDKPPRLGPGGADDANAAVLAFRRCLPGGCLADAKPDAALLKSLRAAAKPGHLSFTDAGERTLVLPVSLRGLAPALDDLARETSRDGGAATR